MRIRPVWTAALLCMFLAVILCAQKKYNGPRPPQPDVPYLLHAGKLIEVETSTAQESQEKGGPLYTVSGAASPTKTPVPEPIFLFRSEKTNPDRLVLYRMEVRGNNRTLQISKSKKDSRRPLFLMVTPLASGLFKVEVNEPLANGEYCLSPEGSNQVFCFAEY
jgi:hypothetical protein